ncbi:hydroxyacylglutathione hydrolase [Alkalilimnicola ehrlichii]|uniref:Hydroxyacylglutathione hydrolase n=1 Tax=Alkalilimnicola ehrlichii TaxID=351052 RepID=A0A3E0X066_9GAMM|nr:hydroxyacylglutathione hydrolase [Alkalilimnicola ehrlichii]RFA30859.1 hydroxyacylglutathione hydrolase [Alkalilimnicola ehrlichii]RFA38810.1 hydroxyacylglutathione hydrolase [Alkalilimnicola ehrlichii]
MDRTIPIKAFSDNYIWLLHDAAERLAVVVDPGAAEPVREELERRGMTLAGILVTHHHPDHVGGVRELLEHFPVPVYGPAQESIPGLTDPLGEGDTVALEALDLHFTVLDVPGHTAGHIAFYGEGMLFCGDTLFAGGCGRLFEGTPAQMHASLSKLSSLPKTTRVYCAHEYTEANLRFASQVESDNRALQKRLDKVRRQRRNNEITVPSTIEEELATNPFLRVNQQSVIEAAERYGNKTLSSPTEVFATVRSWKDAS